MKVISIPDEKFPYLHGGIVTDVIKIPPEYWPAIEELPGDLAMIASSIEQQAPGNGVKLTLMLAQTFRGQKLYFRNVDYLVRQVRDDSIRSAYDNGAKVMELGIKWNLSRRAVEKILSKPDVDT